MALRNAFENLLTERTGRLILAAVQYARDANDRMRVVVDNNVAINGTVSSVLHNSTTAGTYSTWYAPAAALSVDPREPLQYQSKILAETRRQKWKYT